MVELHSEAAPATGGPSGARASRRRWFTALAGRFAAVVEDVADRDVLGRRPTIALAGSATSQWSSRLGRLGRVVELGDAEGGADVVVAVDEIAGRVRGRARARVEAAYEAARPGGRLLVVDRVVSRSPGECMSIDDLCELLVLGTGGSVVLEDLESLARPGEATRTTAFLRLVKLGTVA